MQKDIYQDPVVLEFTNTIVRVYHPIITDEERERRMGKIREGTAEFMRSVYSSRYKTAKGWNKNAIEKANAKAKRAAEQSRDGPERLPVYQ